MRCNILGISLLLASSASQIAMAQETPLLIKKLQPELYTDFPQRSLPGEPTKTESLSTLNRAEDVVPSGTPAQDIPGEVLKFLERNSEQLKLQDNASELKMTGQKSTFVGRTVNFDQIINGIPIEDGHVSVTIDQNGDVVSVASSVVSVPTAKAETVKATPALDEKQALDIAWADLAVTGDLMESPTTQKVYWPENNALTLAYRVDLSVTEPFGYWRYRIDATTGRIISKEERSIKENKREQKTAAGATGATSVPFDSALAKLGAAEAKKEAPVLSSANQSLKIFDPDPITSLGDSALRDDSPPSAFESAYVTVGATVGAHGGKYYLSGKNVRIEDFEPGDGSIYRAPSVSDGNGWTAGRGNNSFNDAMTYYHLEKAIEYVRSLGYTGELELFPNGIAADSDGLHGDDNSHYVPGDDRLAFGHGCVDDNEDVDVIAHEFGHALTYHLNDRWGGGDSGAIGEGFGDYWALTYSLRTKNGSSADPAKVFTWDGIASCWRGRRADVLTARYDANAHYGPHVRMSGFISEELWSTPLFQSYLELTTAGISGQSIDRIILASMETIGSGFSMRALATNVIVTANQLYPGQPYASVFEKNFKAVGILE